MTGAFLFELPESLDPPAVEERLAGSITLGPRRRVGEAWTYYDTFDWRLYLAGYRLRGRRRGSRFEVRLEEPGDGGGGPRLTLPEPPSFAASLAPHPLGRILAPLLANRRLLPRTGVRRRGLSWAVRDARDKTLARLYSEERQAVCLDELDPAALAADGGRWQETAGPALPPRLRLAPLKGYGEEGRAVAELLAVELELEPAAADDELDAVLAACGRRAADYSSKARWELAPAQPAAEAMRGLLGRLLEVQLVNEPGVRRQLDPEFLHDFRVAVRRTRSALGQVEVFPAGALAPFREGFRWLGRVTGPKRDLDVFLEGLDDLLESLPGWAREALLPLRAFLRSRSGTTQAELVAALDSDRYRRLVEGWRRFLEGPAATGDAADRSDPRGRLPIARVASQRIWKAARRVRRRAAAIDETTPVEQVHRLRIDCKKLRYLLELFRSLYAEEEIGQEIKALKQLQEVLGEVNDLAVQQAALRRYAGELSREQTPGGGARSAAPTVDTFLAMGFLLARLHRRQRARRKRLAAALARYLEGRHQDRERRLFALEEAP